jgi:hypothetical protein
VRNYYTIWCLLLLWSPALLAQKVIELKYEQDVQGNYQFYSINHAFCNYILEVDFTSIDNARADHSMPLRAEVKPGRNKLFNLTKQNAGSQVLFKYAIRYNKGCINPVVKTDFTYLLPIAPGKQAQAYELQNLNKPAAGDPQVKDWYVIRLRMNPGDTLYASRRGVVTEVEDNSNLNDSGVASIGEENYLEIVHADCSFGRYGILKRNSALVKPGQLVEAGDPIGLIGGDRFGRGSEARFSVYYNLERTDSLGGEAGIRKIYWVYVQLKFWTKKNGKGMLKHGATYISEFPQSVLMQEKTKTVTKGRKKK